MTRPQVDIHALMILRWADSNACLRVTDTFADYTGFSQDELEAAKLLDWLHADDQERMTAAIESGEGVY